MQQKILKGFFALTIIVALAAIMAKVINDNSWWIPGKELFIAALVVSFIAVTIIVYFLFEKIEQIHDNIQREYDIKNITFKEEIRNIISEASSDDPEYFSESPEDEYDYSVKGFLNLFK